MHTLCTAALFPLGPSEKGSFCFFLGLKLLFAFPLLDITSWELQGISKLFRMSGNQLFPPHKIISEKISGKLIFPISIFNLNFSSNMTMGKYAVNNRWADYQILIKVHKRCDELVNQKLINRRENKHLHYIYNYPLP